MVTDAQKAAQAKYDMKNTKQITLKLNLRTDSDILDKFKSIDNVQGYIKQLIRNDINQCV